MPRKEALPAREIEICKRFESFRRGTKIPRTVFARALGYIPERLANYETARAPIRYDVFKAIHKLFPVSPHWLVTGEGSTLSDRILDDTSFRGEVDERELLSAVYDRILKDRYNDQENRVEEYFFGPDGVAEELDLILYGLTHPVHRFHYTDDLTGRIDTLLSGFLSKMRDLCKKRGATDGKTKPKRRA